MNTTELLKVNVNDKLEKKNGLSYLSWAWAWAEVLKLDGAATWVAHTYGPQGNEEPCMRIGKTAMVHVSVTIKGLRRECMLPVMDHRNKAIQEPDAFQVNTAIMRCLAKAIAMHGLGLYIYAGEDLPEGEPEVKPEPKAEKPPETKPIGARQIAWDELGPEQQHRLDGIAATVESLMPDTEAAANEIAWQELENHEKAALAYRLKPSTTRLLREHAERQHKEAATA